MTTPVYDVRHRRRATGQPAPSDPATWSGDVQWMIAAHTPETQEWFKKR